VATATPAQGELLNYNPESPDWVAVKILIDEVEEEIAARRSHLLFRVNAWILALRIFRRIEERKFILSEPAPRDSEYHKAFTALLEGQGQVLLIELKRHEEIDSHNIGIPFEDISAQVDELRYDYESRYGDMTPARRSGVLREVFGVEE
jgi:hypothetical protein